MRRRPLRVFCVLSFSTLECSLKWSFCDYCALHHSYVFVHSFCDYCTLHHSYLFVHLILIMSCEHYYWRQFDSGCGQCVWYASGMLLARPWNYQLIQCWFSWEVRAAFVSLVLSSITPYCFAICTSSWHLFCHILPVTLFACKGKICYCFLWLLVTVHCGKSDISY